jgi:serine phosphatase RsbU (regulator of sigma subunit)
MIVPFYSPILMAVTACALILIAITIERAILFTRTEKAKQLAEHELDIGRQIQAGFFPTALPQSSGWEVAAYFKAARHVSGDFYDAFHLANARYVGLVIADVCDKGVGAALYMAIFRSLVRILSRASLANGGETGEKTPIDPRRVLKKTIRAINDYISVTHEKDGMFATIFFGILDVETGELAYVNGGHEPPLIVGNGGIKAHLMPTGAAVGAQPEMVYDVNSIRINAGETFLGYTDGVTDARNPAGAFFTKARLVERVAGSHATPGVLIDVLKEELEGFTGGEELFDDITLLAVGRGPTR